MGAQDVHHHQVIVIFYLYSFKLLSVYSGTEQHHFYFSCAINTAMCRCAALHIIGDVLLMGLAPLQNEERYRDGDYENK